MAEGCAPFKCVRVLLLRGSGLRDLGRDGAMGRTYTPGLRSLCQIRISLSATFASKYQFPDYTLHLRECLP